MSDHVAPIIGAWIFVIAVRRFVTGGGGIDDDDIPDAGIGDRGGSGCAQRRIDRRCEGW